jgi:hypothetical protein
LALRGDRRRKQHAARDQQDNDTPKSLEHGTPP